MPIARTTATGTGDIARWSRADNGAVAASPTVLIDPDGSAGSDWMYVVVQRRRDVWYVQQYGGTACRQGRVQGYLVPVDGSLARTELDQLFLVELGGTGLWGGARAPSTAVLEQVKAAVAKLRFWESIPDAPEPYPLVLDLSRAADVDEAWVPVLTPDGPGVPLWPNSD